MMYKLTMKLIFVVLSVFLMGLHSLASGPATGSIVVQGEVMINGTASVSQTTLVSGNHIVTKDNSSAVASLGTLGKIFLNSKTDLVLNFNENGVQVELLSGSIRLQKAAESKMEVLTKICSSVEVMKGEVVTINSKHKETRASDNTVRAGELHEYKEASQLLHKGMASEIDYRVSTIECKAGAAFTA